MSHFNCFVIHGNSPLDFVVLFYLVDLNINSFSPAFVVCLYTIELCVEYLYS